MPDQRVNIVKTTKTLARLVRAEPLQVLFVFLREIIHFDQLPVGVHAGRIILVKLVLAPGAKFINDGHADEVAARLISGSRRFIYTSQHIYRYGDAYYL